MRSAIPWASGRSLLILPFRRDHAKRVQRVARLMYLQGVAELILAGVFALVWVAGRPGADAGGEYLRLVALYAPVATLTVAAAAAAKVAASRLNREYRGLRLGTAALLAAPLSLCTVSCLPSALALAAYGLWVYSDPTVRAAFARRARGASVAEVEADLGSRVRTAGRRT